MIFTVTEIEQTLGVMSVFFCIYTIQRKKLYLCPQNYISSTMLGIGVMTGTSLDAIDLAACLFEIGENDTYTFKLVATEAVSIEPLWKDRLLKLPHQSAEIYAKTHVYFAHYLGKHIAAFIQKHALKPDFVAVHGQTIFHQPDANFTAQIADGETLVTYLDCPLVCNFRNKDIALGGQGAPLVPIGEKYLFPEQRFFLNLGGFANMTYNKANDTKTIAFDVCACNIVLNEWANKYDANLEYDKGGEIAQHGTLYEAFFADLNGLSYYRQPPPKSLGWEWVAENLNPLLHKYDFAMPDVMRTYTEHIAFQIARASTKLQAQGAKLVVTGGGRHNTFLMERLAFFLEKIDISIDTSISDEVVDFKESIIFAFLGLRTLTGKSNTLASVTGAKMAAISGSIHLPAQGWEIQILRENQ